MVHGLEPCPGGRFQTDHSDAISLEQSGHQKAPLGRLSREEAEGLTHLRSGSDPAHGYAPASKPTAINTIRSSHGENGRSSISSLGSIMSGAPPPLGFVFSVDLHSPVSVDVNPRRCQYRYTARRRPLHARIGVLERKPRICRIDQALPAARSAPPPYPPRTCCRRSRQRGCQAEFVGPGCRAGSNLHTEPESGSRFMCTHVLVEAGAGHRISGREHGAACAPPATGACA